MSRANLHSVPPPEPNPEPRKTARPRWVVVTVLIVTGLVIVAVGLIFVRPSNAPPAQASEFYVDPGSPAATQEVIYRSQGREADAAKMKIIADQPIPTWLTTPTDVVGAEVSSVVSHARALGKTPLFVAYRLPFRDCGSYSGGGARDDADYRAWIHEVGRALDGGPAIVVLEPDAVSHVVTGCGKDRSVLLANAIDVLNAGGAKAYVDGGNPGFVTDVGAVAQALRRSGVDKAAGFSLNVANFWATPDVITYGTAISRALGGAHFVIDTSRNGTGRPEATTINGGPAYCNPPGRQLGQTPTRLTGQPLIDAYLWIKRVGESDGACRPGEPPAGQWWPEYALGLVTTH